MTESDVIRTVACSIDKIRKALIKRNSYLKGISSEVMTSHDVIDIILTESGSMRSFMGSALAAGISKDFIAIEMRMFNEHCVTAEQSLKSREDV